MVTRPTIKTYLLAGVAIAALGSPALAQEEPALLEEIIVTAEKRAQSLQDVPISIVAYTGDQLQNQSVDNIQGIAVETPSMAFSRAGGEAQLYIRGIGTNAFGVTVDPSVAMHQDGVYLGRSQMGLTQFLDVERVEILRGPQGTLYGRNATAGAINIISRAPTEEWEGYVRGALGSWDRREIEGAVSGAVADGVLARLSFKSLEDDGFTKDLDPRGGDQIDDNDLFAVRGQVEFGRDEALNVRIIADWSEFNSGNRTIIPRDNLGLAETLGALPLGDFDDTRNDLSTYEDWEFWGLTMLADFEVNENVTISSVTGYKSYESDFLFNTDGTEIDITRSNFQYDTEQFSQELRVDASWDGFDILLGGYYLHEDKQGALGLIRANISTTFVIPNEDEVDALAAFGQATFHVSEQLRLIGGLRYSYEKKKDFTSIGGLFGPAAFEGLDSPSAVTVFSTRDDQDSWNDLSPRFVVQYDVNDDVNVFASVSKAFKSGGWNAFTANASFDEEKLWSYEVGARSELMDGRLRLNATAFYYDYKDLQVTTTLNSLTVTTNAASATNKGLEIEAIALPTPEWRIGVSGSYLDAKYDEFLSPFGICPADATPAEIAGACNGAAPGATRTFDLSDNTLTNAPEFKFNVNSTYDVVLANGGTVTLYGQVAYQSKVYFTQFNEDVVGQDGFALADARVSYTSPDDRWSVGFLVKNIFDKEYFQNGVRFTSTSDPAKDRFQIGNSLGYPAQGRSWALQARVNF